ncbi:MAG: hypothetical protein M0R03_21235 [Novosphingobium sp.]|nr:hypothetical protein [Novosphingobium sp.]
MDKIIELALKDFDLYLKESNWYGRENEVVNLFAHRFLSKYVGEAPLFSLDQIGIEVAVKQIPSNDGKELVRKDLVIWKEGESSVWNENGEIVNNPLAIIEWKVNDISKCDYDINWLKEYRKIYPEVIGYSLCAFIKGDRGIEVEIIK